MPTIKAKKSLGQNFLKSKNLAEKIISPLKIKKIDTIIEIGPGKGILTKILLEKSNKIIAIEKDQVLVQKLKIKFLKDIEAGNLKIIGEDFLKVKNLKINSKTKIIGNIPYNITGKIFRKIFEQKNSPVLLSFLIQKEVADKIINQKKSKLSLIIECFGKAKKEFNISRKFFNPVPKVDSSLIKIDFYLKNIFIKEKIKREKFFNFLQLSFSQKRKTLINNLKSQYHKEKIIKALEKTKLNLNTRPEDIDLKNFIKIFKDLSREK